MNKINVVDNKIIPFDNTDVILNFKENKYILGNY